MFLFSTTPIVFEFSGHFFQKKSHHAESLFQEWYDRKKIISTVRVYLLLFFSFSLASIAYISSFSCPWVLCISWISLGLACDVFLASLFSIRKKSYLLHLLRFLSRRLQRALREKKIDEVIALCEQLFLLVGEACQTNKVSEVKTCTKEIMMFVETTSQALSYIPLFQKEVADESLTEKMAFFEAIMAKKMSSFAAEAISDIESSRREATLDGLLHITLQLFLYFQEKNQDLGYIFLNSIHQTLIYKKNRERETIENRESALLQYSVVLSEGIKSVLAISDKAQHNYCKSIFRLLAMLESVVKEQFQHNRSLNPALLMQPFAEIGQYIGQMPHDNISGKSDILAHLKQILSQFAVLETVTHQLHQNEKNSMQQKAYKENQAYTETL